MLFGILKSETIKSQKQNNWKEINTVGADNNQTGAVVVENFHRL